MFKFLKRHTKSKNLREIAEKKLEENRAVIESLRDYDEGKKDISTTKVERYLRGIQSAS